MRDEERHVTAETNPPPGAPKERAKKSKVPGGGVAIIALGVGVGIAVILYYGYATRPGWVGVSGKQFWDYLDLLIVPAALALGVYWLNRRQNERDQQAEDAQQERALEVENQRAQDDALQAYLDQMSQLLLGKDTPLRQSEEDSETRILARARTLTVLARMDRTRKVQVVRFLFEAGLLSSYKGEGGPILYLGEADLSGVDLSTPFTFLNGISLGGADLHNAYLSGAYLRVTDLGGANLQDADLSGAHLTKADLGNADLRRVAQEQGPQGEWVERRFFMASESREDGV